MPLPFTRRLPLALPILFYLLALVALRMHMHLPSGDTPLLIVALLAGLLGIGIGVGLVLRHRITLRDVSSSG